MIRKPVLLAVLAALAGGALLGCLDAIAPHRAVARGISFGIVPVFEGYGVRDGIPTDVDLIRITLHDPPAPDISMDYPIRPGQEEIRIEIPITLNGVTDTVGVTFQAIRSSDNTTLYSGTHSVPITVGPPAPPAPVVARYVGPGGNILSISISPAAATLKPGDDVTFGFLAIDSTGATIIGMPVLFASRNAGVLTVSSGGVAHGVSEGQTYLVVTSGARSSVKDSARVTVSRTAPSVSSLSVLPRFQVLRTGDTLRLQVSAKDANGNAVPSPGAGFTSRSPGVASVGSSTGLVTGVSGGTAVIVASAGTGSDSMEVAVAGNGSAVASATASGDAFATARVGDTVKVQVAVDLRAVSTEKLGSYNAQLTWNTTALRYVSSGSVTGGFAQPTVNETLTSSGQLRFGSADPNGASGPITLIEIRFVGAAAGSSPLTLALTDLSAARTFTNLLSTAVVVSGGATIH